MNKVIRVLQMLLFIALVVIIYLMSDREVEAIVSKECDVETEYITVEKEVNQYQAAGIAYDVDPLLLEAIERLETGNFTSDVFKQNNNAYGGIWNGEHLSYASHYQSTMELARLLRFSYYNKGITDLNEIGKIYCPDDIEWAQKVREIYEELRNEKI